MYGQDPYDSECEVSLIVVLSDRACYANNANQGYVSSGYGGGNKSGGTGGYSGGKSGGYNSLNGGQGRK